MLSISVYTHSQRLRPKPRLATCPSEPIRRVGLKGEAEKGTLFSVYIEKTDKEIQGTLPGPQRKVRLTV